jgi:hypothetical protein
MNEAAGIKNKTEHIQWEHSVKWQLASWMQSQGRNFENLT